MSDPVLPDWAQELDLSPHPEGGWFAETWRSDLTLPETVLPSGYSGARSAGTAIYFLLLPGEESAWHTVRGAEIWLHHRGAPVILDLGGTDDAPGAPQPIALGPDVTAGQRPQAVVPPGCWQRARPARAEAALVSAIVVPGFDFDDFRLA
ncbi:cupin domain-containing protein [Gordonia sp. ABSL1-1]|uniref:cupin domain-containing protein n=1 Tax=Gordonia sp. ABSL1-1 TaxID=3053923 RepID=UPI0025722537|nr:cupin domain-containing protein [Gordonia sp. ABSL1-1]MDL9935634.1 cupin domain-containing protein [Gordonia sp. ABSL1-1]